MIEQKLQELGIEIPQVAKPAAAYLPYVVNKGILHASGQLPIKNGEITTKGIVGKNGVSIQDAQNAAMQCAVNLVACIKDACDGDLTKLRKILHLQILVYSDPEFTEQHLVANGASNFLVEVFGDEVGAHSRAAYGVASIPLGASVEIAGVFDIS